MSIATIGSYLELPYAHFPVLIEFKNVYVALLAVNCDSPFLIIVSLSNSVIISMENIL